LKYRLEFSMTREYKAFWTVEADGRDKADSLGQDVTPNDLEWKVTSEKMNTEAIKEL